MGAPEIIKFGAPSNLSSLLLDQEVLVDDLQSGVLARGLNFELGGSRTREAEMQRQLRVDERRTLNGIVISNMSVFSASCA
jgi:hypothetical protein